jgi:hypothetical protein
MKVMQNVADAFINLGQKLSTDTAELSRGMATGALKNMNSAKYASGFASGYKSAAKAADVPFLTDTVEALQGATDYKSVAKIVKNNPNDEVLNSLFNSQTQIRNKATASLRENASAETQKSFINYMKNQKGILNKGLLGAEAGKAYFAEEGKQGARIGTAIAGTAAAGVGLRYLDGGNLTHNSSGERDIVGVPFV